MSAQQGDTCGAVCWPLRGERARFRCRRFRNCDWPPRHPHEVFRDGAVLHHPVLLGGMSHHETWDPKPDAPVKICGEFSPIATVVPGIRIGEHIPLLAQHTDKLAIIRSVHHDDSAHGRGMYWNLTGNRPPCAGNIPPLQSDWPSLPAVVSRLRSVPRGFPSAVRLPYPMVDNGTLQAGKYGE